MILDAQNQYSNAQALTASAASDNLIDHQKDRDLGIGEPIALIVTVGVAADGTTGDETYSVALQVASDAAFTSPVSLGSFSIPRGTAAGSKFVLPVPPDTSFDEFSRVNYTLGGTTPSITVSAFLQPMNMIQNNNVYKDALVIS